MEEKYTIRVCDERVEIEGDLTIRDAFDFLSFFDQQGFNTLVRNCDGETITLSKRDLEKEERTRIIEESISDNKYYESLYHQSEVKVKNHEIKIFQLDSLLKALMKDGQRRDEIINELNNEVSKYKSLLKLEEAVAEGKINVER